MTTFPNSSIPLTDITKFGAAQRSVEAPLGPCHEEEVQREKSIILRVAQHDPKRSLKDLRWSQARVRIFTSNGDRYTQYRIRLDREDGLVTSYVGNIMPIIITRDPASFGYSHASSQQSCSWVRISGTTTGIMVQQRRASQLLFRKLCGR